LYYKHHSLQEDAVWEDASAVEEPESHPVRDAFEEDMRKA